MIKDSYGNTRFFGVYRGVAFDTSDPLGKNRIRVKVPQILANNATQWAWPVGVVGNIPTVGEGVWLQFEGGDPSYPIWQGSFSGNLVTGGGVPETASAGITVSVVPPAPATAVPVVAGGTGQTSVNIGEIIVGGALNTTVKIPPVAVGSALISQGDNAVPVWGDVPLSAGGTGASLTGVDTGVVYSKASSMAISAGGTTGQVLQLGSSAPAWVNPLTPNLIVNGAFEIWQRYRTTDSYPGLTGSAAFSADRWRGNGGTGYVWSKLSSPNVGLTGFQYAMRVSRTAGTVAGVAPNKAELIRDLETATSIPLQGQTATLSFYARAGATFSATTNNTITVDTFTGIGTDENLTGTANGTATSGYHPLPETTPATPVGTGPAAVVVDPVANIVYIANQTAGTVVSVDGTTGAVLATVTLATGAQPQSIARNPTTRLLYVANYGNSTVSVIYEVGMILLSTITVGSYPLSIAVNPTTNKIYVARESSRIVVVIDGSNNATSNITISSTTSVWLSSLAVNSVTNRVYVTAYDNSTYAGTVTVINGLTNAILGTPFAVAFPISVAVNAVTNMVYVACGYTVPGSLYLVVINGATGTSGAIVGNSTSTGVMQGLSVNSVTNTVYGVGVGGSNNYMNAINGTTYQLINSTIVGNTPYAVAVNETTNKEYVVNFADNSLTIVNGNLKVGQTSTPISLTTSWARYSVTIPVSNLATQLGFSINYTPTASSTAGASEYFDITGVQLEGGSIVTPFRRSTPSIQEELARCQRTYYALVFPTTGASVAVGGAIYGGNLYATINFPVTMRSSPVAGTSSVTPTGTFTVLSNGGTTAPVNSFSWTTLPYSAIVTANLSSPSITVGLSGLLVSTSGAVRYFDFTAEL